MNDDTPVIERGALSPRDGLRATVERPTAMRLTQVAGQYVLTPQPHGMPSLAQISPSGVSTVQSGVTRIISISPSRGQNASMRPSLTNQSIVNVLQSRNSNVVLQLFQNNDTTSNATTAAHSRPLKRTASTSEKKDSFAAKQQRVTNHMLVRSKLVKEKYAEHLLEEYFLSMGGNILDLHQFSKRPRTDGYLAYMKEHAIDLKENTDESSLLPTTQSSIPKPPCATEANSLPGFSRPNNRKPVTTTTATVAAAVTTPSAPQVNIKVSQSATINNQEQMVEKVKQEAYVVNRIADLQRDGLWSEKRLPKVQEMSRGKAHWDFLLEEMVWLAADFAQERKWKKAAAKKCARMVQKYFQDKAVAAQKAEKAHEQHLRRIAAFCAKEIKTFWNNVEKLVEYKQNTILDEKRKKALDQQLSFIVDQTEKYSQLLAEGMNKQNTEMSSNVSSRRVSRNVSDDEFDPDAQSEDDDEETIEQEEAAITNDYDQTKEVEALQRESQMELDDLLEDELLRNYILNRDSIRLDESDNSNDAKWNDDKKYKRKKEMGDQIISKLRKIEKESEESEAEDDASDDSEDDDDDDDENDEMDNKQTENQSLKLLIGDAQTDEREDLKTEKKGDLINDVAAIAESIQPKGNTLSSTTVSTNVPFLLKLPLREYQHIGLDWLVTMYERKLNGILADEMGLGKTIQTIALLAHLACEQGNWGPHLIVVPTSVMLNWEMECKKWCPAFKILTYYGSHKERRLKRTGWTKPNSFHICITSYKLVVQDQQSFRRKKWKYLILDEAQNIKNFKSQRWQLLLNFQTDRRLLLTGTPLQNNLMELWSLMHFLMPNVFQSHKEFNEWFSNPVTGMIEGNTEYNESIIKRLHKVLRPFLLRRLKSEVEKQMPKKYEHVVMCRLSKRQRFLYDDYMSRTKTRETLSTGNLLSVINALMQLRKVCNHPNLFEVRPTISPFQSDNIKLHIPSIVYSALFYDIFKHVNLYSMNLLLIMLEMQLGAYQCFYMRQSAKKSLPINQNVNDLQSPYPPPCKLSMSVKIKERTTDCSTIIEKKTILNQTTLKQQSMKVKLSGVQLVPQGIVKAIPLVNISQASGQVQVGAPINMSTVLKPVDKLSANFAQLVQTPTGKHLLLTSNPNMPVTSTSSGSQKLTFLSKPTMGGGNTPSLAKAFLKVQLGSMTGTGTSVSVTKNATTTLLASKEDPGLKSVPSNFLGQLYSKQNSLDVRWPKCERTCNVEKQENAKIAAKRKLMTNINEKRCSALPLYGKDFQDSIKVFKPNGIDSWSGGYINCLNSLYSKNIDETASFFSKALYNPKQRLEQLKDICDRFIFYVPAVKANEPEIRVWHPPPSEYWARKEEKQLIQRLFSKPAMPLHHIASAMITQFPDPRLIQYDCGKLQIMDKLLRKLKAENHRILIFTQMTKMLDVLEEFLNFHGHIYLRLDGTTKIEQRQVLMERFNGDKRIFAFILSTRSGGVGVNLTGADTVIFYDSDWNPTMDAQAQDRCHRIGQTRDVHIYRLISERTIEENILKKANQKRLLSDLAIEGGNFTTAYFKSTTIQDLFNIDGTADAAAQGTSDMIERSRDRDKPASIIDSSNNGDEKSMIGALENALACCEDDQDVQATKTAKAEAVADLAEFDENIPLDIEEKDQEISKAEQEINNIIEKLTPIEKYAMKFIEQTESAWSAEQLAAAAQEIEKQKREWEANQMAAMREEEERRAREIEEEADAITYTREDATNQMWISDNTMEQMPIWCPPTPPQDDEEIYIDQTVSFLYDSSIIPESQLPPVYVKKEGKHRYDPVYGYEYKRPMKVSKRADSSIIPKSLFHPPSQMKLKRDMKIQKCRSILHQSSAVALGKTTGTKLPIEQSFYYNWLRHEEANLLKGIHRFQNLSTNPNNRRAAQTPNWDLLADMINSVSFTHRSQKQCRHRYECSLLSREEERAALENSNRKRKKNAQLQRISYLSKSRSALRTGSYDEDNRSFFEMLKERIECISTTMKKNEAIPSHGLKTTSTFQTSHQGANAPIVVTQNDFGPMDYKVNILELATKSMENILTKKASPDQKNKQAKAILANQQQAQKMAAMSLAHQNALPTSQAVIPQSTAAVATTTVSTTTVHTTTLRSQRIFSSSMQTSTVVSVSGLLPSQLQQASQRLTVLAGTSSGQSKTGVGSSPTCVTSKQLTPAQLQIIRQASLKSQIRINPNALPQGTKTSTVTIGGQQAIVQFTQTQQRPQFIRQGTVTVAGKASGLTRAVTESEVALLLKKQHQLQQQKLAAAGNVQVKVSNAGGNIITSQVFAQAIQQASTTGTPVATLVKAMPSNSTGMSQTVTIPVTGVTIATASGRAITPTIKTATTQQIHQMQIRQQLLAQKKLAANAQKLNIAQVAGKSNVQAQLIVGSKPLPTTMTVQQFQQVIKSAPLNVPQSPVILTKGGSRVIPVNTGQGGKQTIQVVAASSQALSSALRPQNVTPIAGIKLQSSVSSSQQAALISQVSAALNQNITLRQQNSPVRIQTAGGQPVVSVTIPSSSAPPSQNP